MGPKGIPYMQIGAIAKVRFRRFFAEQRCWAFVGYVRAFTENWVTIEGIGILYSTGQTSPIDVDEELRTLILPRETIAHIRILPDTFDLKDIQTYRKGYRWFLKVKDGPDASLGEV